MISSRYDVVVAGGGAAGLAAALESRKRGIQTLLVESSGGLGGCLFSGMPILGAYSSRGEKCVGGLLDEITREVKALSPEAYMGPICDWRTVYGLCVDPEVLRLAICRLIEKYKVDLLVNSKIISAEVADSRLLSLAIASSNACHTVSTHFAVDATGGGRLTELCGGGLMRARAGEYQPISLTFRMCNVNFKKLLKYVEENPTEALLGENPVMEQEINTAAKKLACAGFPYVALSARGKLMGDAIEQRRISPCTAAFLTPTSFKRRELCINVTRLAEVDCGDDFSLSDALTDLAGQVASAARFFRESVPGFPGLRFHR